MILRAILLMLLVASAAGAQVKTRWQCVTGGGGGGGQACTIPMSPGAPMLAPGMIMVDLNYAWPNAKSGLRDADGSMNNCGTTPGGAAESICLNAEAVTDDSGEKALPGGENDTHARVIFPTGTSCKYDHNPSSNDGIQCFGTTVADESLSTYYCRNNTSPFAPCGSGAGCVGDAADAQHHQGGVLFDPSTNKVIRTEVIDAPDSWCSLVNGSSILFARADRSVTSDFSLEGWEYQPYLADMEHFSYLGALAIGEYIAKALKWEFAFYPDPRHNLLENGRAEQSCVSNGSWGIFDAGTPGSEALQQTTYSHTDHSQPAFQGNGCQLVNRNDAGDAIVLGPMDGLQMTWEESFGAGQGINTRYFACHFLGSAAGATGAIDDALRVEVVDSDVPANKHTMLAEGADPTDNDVNEFKVWTYGPEGWRYWAGAGTTQAKGLKAIQGDQDNTMGILEPIVVTFEVESCDQPGNDVCEIDNVGEEFEIRFWLQDTISPGNTPVAVDEAYCYETAFDQNPLDLHDILGDDIDIALVGASNSTGINCTPPNFGPGTAGCEWPYWTVQRLGLTGRTVNVVHHRGDNNIRSWDYIYNDRFNVKYRSTIRSVDPHYVLMNLGQNDMDQPLASITKNAEEITRSVSWLRAETNRSGAILVYVKDFHTRADTTEVCGGGQTQTCGEIWDEILGNFLDYGAQIQGQGGMRKPVP